STQKEVYALRKSAIDIFVNDELLKAEAVKRAITPQALLDVEVTSKVPTITDLQAQTFFDQNKSRINGDFAQIKPQIVDYLKQQEQEKLEKAFVDRLRAAAQVQYFIPPPVPPTYAIDLTDRPVMGSATAPVTIAVFVDYQCTTCAAFHAALLR